MWHIFFPISPNLIDQSVERSLQTYNLVAHKSSAHIDICLQMMTLETTVAGGSMTKIQFKIDECIDFSDRNNNK